MAKRKKKNVEEQATDPLSSVKFPRDLPVLTAKDIVAFPSVMMSLYVERAASLKAVDNAVSDEGLIFVVAQANLDTDTPGVKDLHKVGVVANVIRVLKVGEGKYKLLIQGLARAKTKKVVSKGGVLVANVDTLKIPEESSSAAKIEIIINKIRENLQMLVEHERLPEEVLIVAEDIDDPGVFADAILAHYKLEVAKAQEALEEVSALKRLKMTEEIIANDLNQFLVTEKIKDKARDEMTRGQHEFYLREQIRQIQRELGENDEAGEELQALKSTLDKARMPKDAADEAKKQFKRLERMHPESSEYAILRTYLDWMGDLPWAKRTVDRLDLKVAEKILDEDHNGLDKPKNRILEYLSVRKLNKDSKGPILCFVGPPGVGKTSLGRSVAKALGRKFFRMSLGGMRDEAEIRGHRRTYVGALPGRIIQGLKQVQSKNPVIVLDELDKLGNDFRGDPASALLEVLDPQQNREFRDHYLNVDFDLSEVLFIATANTMDTIPEALLDRLEVISIPGYTLEEKREIAQRYLVPRQLTENGLSVKKIKFQDQALEFLIDRYTRESGVRNLEREVGSVCRKLARDYAERRKLTSVVTPKVVRELLGIEKFDPEETEPVDAVGLVRGLAWTLHGGEMMAIEASVAKGGGSLNLTGQLGQVMQESAQAALFWIRSNAQMLDIDPNFYSKSDIHIHAPAGAIPKDGPSAGVTIATALVSALTKQKVSREFAMTGEMTLRGNVLPVGGVKEKALAALRHGIAKVIIPYENIKDLEEIPKEQRKQIKFLPVKHISEVLQLVLMRGAKTQSKVSRRGSEARA